MTDFEKKSLQIKIAMTYAGFSLMHGNPNGIMKGHDTCYDIWHEASEESRKLWELYINRAHINSHMSGRTLALPA